MTAPLSPHAEIVVDLGAIRHNVRRLRELVWGSATTEGPTTPKGAMMVVVKADGYGHGMVPVARAARAAGADWLGVATLEEALALRLAGDTGRLLCWLAAPGADFTESLRADIDVAAYSVLQLEEIVAASRQTGRVARVHLKVDTGLSRGGASRADWDTFLAAAHLAEEQGSIRAVGLWSHLACSDEPEHPANADQVASFRAAVEHAEAAGLRLEVRHLANSAGAILLPETRHDLVRMGIAVYGLNPAPDVLTDQELGLVPAMTVSGSVVMAKELAPGDGVSYGHHFHAPSPMRVALVPMGYADGVPRSASNTAEVLIGGQRRRVLGRICMDQLVAEGPGCVAGDEVVLFGPGTRGEPTATDWARWCGTINYEIVTRMGGRQRRVWTGESDT